MVDNNQMPADGEYQVKEEGYAAIPPLTLGIATKPAIGRLKRVFIVIALVLIVFFAYNFFNWYSDQKQSKKITMPANVATPALAAPLPLAAATSDNSANVVKNDLNDAVRKQLDVLSQGVESNREQLAELSNSLVQEQKTVENLNRNIAGLVTSLQELARKASVSESTVSPENKIATKKKRISSKVATKKLPVYHVKAIVPERAWLESAAGDTVSVRIGDKLAGYGTIRAISPRQGEVVTDTQVIRYGANDF